MPRSKKWKKFGKQPKQPTGKYFLQSQLWRKPPKPPRLPWAKLYVPLSGALLFAAYRFDFFFEPEPVNPLGLWILLIGGGIASYLIFFVVIFDSLHYLPFRKQIYGVIVGGFFGVLFWGLSEYLYLLDLAIFLFCGMSVGWLLAATGLYRV
jgi:hypothetical protein